MIPKKTDLEGRVKSSMQGLPHSPVVKTPPSNSRSMGSTNGRETKLRVWPKIKKKKRSGVWLKIKKIKVRGEVQVGDATQKHSEYIDSIFSLETG